jgi:CDP-L-myo-inositol myo-inositolphosphotransferase
VAVIAALFFFFGKGVVGGLLTQLSSILDGTDGEIARLKSCETGSGGFFDAILDRYADAIVIAGVFWYLLNAAEMGMLWLYLDSFSVIYTISMMAIVGSLMVSYTAARSVKDLGLYYRGNRDIRLFLLSLGGIFSFLNPTSLLLALFSVAIIANTIVAKRAIVAVRNR